MSASREKKQRKTDRSVDGLTVSPEKKKSPKNNDRMYGIFGIIVAVVLVISLGTAIFQNVVGSGKFAAVTVGDEKIYAHEVNYYYVNTYLSFINSYGDYISYMGIDTSAPLDSQQCAFDSSITWHEYFRQSAVSTLRETKMFVGEAAAAGVTLSEENRTRLEEDIESLKQSVADSEMTYETYLSAYYGDKMTPDEYMRIAEENYLADQYGTEVYNTPEYTEDEITAYYDENTNNFDLVDYKYFFFSSVPDSENPTDADIAAAKSEAQSLSAMMAGAVSDETSFDTQAIQYADEDSKEKYEDPDYSLITEATYSSLSASSTDLADWLFSSDRVIGDCGVVETDSGYYVLFLKDRYRNDYRTRNVRHILVNFELDEDASEATDEQKAAALEEAEQILEDWKSGEATEDSFAELANEFSDDAGSNTNGGLYEDVYKGQMVENFENWLFDASRQPGDTGIVESPYGYHIMYYVSEGPAYWTVQVETALRNEDYNTYTETAYEKYPLKEHFIGEMAVGLPA